jgi:hypothetical protein
MSTKASTEAHTHDLDEPGLIVEMHLREHMAEVHGRMVAGEYATLYRRHAEDHPELFQSEAGGEREAEGGTRVTVTARELLDRLVWDRACDMLGLNPWAVNEGQMDSGERLTFTLEQAQTLGLLRGDRS